MSPAAVAGLLLVASLWVALPDPRRQVRRLSPAASHGWWTAILRGRRGAATLRGRPVSVDRPSVAAARAGLADTVELLAVCLSAGASMRRALEVVGEVSGPATALALARVTGQVRMGVPEEQAWLELADDDVWGPVARDVARSARSGTSLVAVLRVHADEARVLLHEQTLQRARTAGVRSVVPLTVCFLPAFVLVGVVPIIAGLLAGFSSP